MASIARDIGRRAAILGAATEVFLEAGYGAGAVDEVVRRAGGSKSTVYAHFGSKEGLFAEVVESVLGELASSVATDLRGESLETGLHRIATRLYAIVTSERHIALARMVIAEARRFPELGRIYHERGPARATRWITAFLRPHLGGEAAAEAAEWFAGKLIHRAFIERLCIGDAPADPQEVAREADRAVKGVLRLMARDEGETGPCG